MLTFFVQIRVLEVVLLDIVDAFLQLRLHDLGINDQHVNHGQYLEYNPLLRSQITDSFEGKKFLLFFILVEIFFIEL